MDDKVKSLYNDLMKGLEECAAYERGEIDSKTTTLSTGDADAPENDLHRLAKEDEEFLKMWEADDREWDKIVEEELREDQKLLEELKDIDPRMYHEMTQGLVISDPEAVEWLLDAMEASERDPQE